MTKELSSCGDHAVVTVQSNVTAPETLGVEGGYEFRLGQNIYIENLEKYISIIYSAYDEIGYNNVFKFKKSKTLTKIEITS